uniref:Uncharacterized protein n=1 Tax=Triticum urartu TaxID=4572 RepID=A0A8R7QF87_TRIUA
MRRRRHEKNIGCSQFDDLIKTKIHLVVKRQTIPDIGNDDEVPISGRKRHVQQRLGNNVVVSDSYRSRHSNKRCRRYHASKQGDQDHAAGAGYISRECHQGRIFSSKISLRPCPPLQRTYW